MKQSCFSDRLFRRIQSVHSCLVAGFDPILEDLPAFILEAARRECAGLEDQIEHALTRFYTAAINAIGQQIAAVKPNLAFFEQYGLAGLRALCAITALARSHSIPIIADAKRGDIGSTAQAYSNAYLGCVTAFGHTLRAFEADALTVNPFLGFDTIEVFLKDCQRFGKGMFLLVKTSNPGSGDLQDCRVSGAHSVTQKIASWISEHAAALKGECGYSSLGAVVGATYPEELAALRSAMPNSFFLIPGLGAQGGKASDIVAGFNSLSPRSTRGGAIVNVSRGLFSKLPTSVVDEKTLSDELLRRAAQFNAELSTALEQV